MDIDTNLSDCGFSQEFLERSGQMGFRTLADILDVAPGDLMTLHGFSYHWLAELTGYLNRHGALSLLQQLPGKILP